MAATREATDPSSIADRVHKVRTEKHVSRVRLAELAGGGMTSPKISRIERGGIRDDEVPVVLDLLSRIEEANDRARDVPARAGNGNRTGVAELERRLGAVLPLVRGAREARTRGDANSFLDQALRVLAEGAA